jgi:hypothetical protein
MKVILSSAFALAIAFSASSAEAQITMKAPDKKTIEGRGNSRCVAVLLIEQKANPSVSEEMAKATVWHKAQANSLLGDQAIPTFKVILDDEMTPLRRESGPTTAEKNLRNQKVENCIKSAPK